jgi:NAD+ kinase
MIISIGGDGTMLATAYHAQFYNKPVFGINLGKLGFLVDANIDQLEKFIEELKHNKYSIEERMVIEGECVGHKVEKLYAVNDIVFDKGGWPKMIEITITVNGEYVTTFAADGLIVATPTGSTGYSISVGGPIVSPKADVITLSPVSPHSLSMRPLVLPSNQEIIIRADSFHKEVHINCDGQRVFSFSPPLEIKITKSGRPLKIVRTSFISYFETLRSKLLWGIDLRKNTAKEK